MNTVTERINVKNLRIVNQSVPKVDAPSLVTGKAVYTNDLAPSDCLIVKVLRSPHAHALIKEINTARAEAVPGIECILTYRDCPDKRFTMAGQTYPEPSPYDRLILDQRVRFVGDAAAIVAGTSEEAVKKAMKLIKVKYEVLEPVLDFRKAKDNPILVHPEDNWKSLCPVGADNKRNLCAHGVLRLCDRPCIPYEGEPAGDDGNISYLYLFRYIRKAEYRVLHAGSLPCPPHPCERTRYPEI